MIALVELDFDQNSYLRSLFVRQSGHKFWVNMFQSSGDILYQAVMSQSFLRLLLLL